MNITILTASTGGGHNRASRALKDYIDNHCPDDQADVIDALQECSALLNSFVVNGYKALLTVSPPLFGMLYKVADKPSPLAELIQIIYSQCSKRLLPIIQEKRPDVVISCHPFTGGILSYMKLKHGYDVPLISIVTDFFPHRAYVAESVDAYVTASQRAKDILTEDYPIPAEKVFFYGLPVYESFYEGKGRDRAQVLSELGLDPAKQTVLMMAGSYGVTDILSIYERMVSIDLDYQLIVITGRNKKLYEAFEKLLADEKEFETDDAPELLRELPEDSILRSVYNDGDFEDEADRATFRRTTDSIKPTKLFYFVDNVDDYMHASDLIITKPGGLTTSESIACALPMAILRACPGQEAQNAELLVEKGIGVNLGKGENAAEQIEELLRHPEKLDSMRAACRQYVRKGSSERIYELAKELAGKKNNR